MANNSKRWLGLIIAFLSIVILPGCSGGGKAEKPAVPDKFEAIRAHIDNWLANINIDSMIIPSSYLMDSIVSRWDDAASLYQLISLRSPTDYGSAGHIAHAINIPWVEIVSDGNLAKLDSSKTLILYCYYGHGSMIGTAILELMGYKCLSLGFGMMDWNLDAVVKPRLGENPAYDTDTTMFEMQDTYAYPVLKSNHIYVERIIQDMARQYFSGEGSPVIQPAAVRELIAGWDTASGLHQIVDVRSANDYRAGHLSHAIHIPWRDLARPENLRKLDKDRITITYSENGQIGQMSSTILNLLGYKAVNMNFGMLEWNADLVDSTFHWDGTADYPVEF